MMYLSDLNVTGNILLIKQNEFIVVDNKKALALQRTLCFYTVSCVLFGSLQVR